MSASAFSLSIPEPIFVFSLAYREKPSILSRDLGRACKNYVSSIVSISPQQFITTEIKGIDSYNIIF